MLPNKVKTITTSEHRNIAIIGYEVTEVFREMLNELKDDAVVAVYTPLIESQLMVMDKDLKTTDMVVSPANKVDVLIVHAGPDMLPKVSDFSSIAKRVWFIDERRLGNFSQANEACQLFYMNGFSTLLVDKGEILKVNS